MDHLTFPRYEDYKASGFDWLGDIPTGWPLQRLGAVFEERKEKVSDKDFPALSVTKGGILPQLDSAAKSDDGDNRKGVHTGDFVINSRSDRKGSSGIAKQDGSVSLINIVLKPKGIDPQYCEHLLKSNGFIEEFYRNGHGIVADLWTTKYWDMKSIFIPVPDMATQQRIANFLDQKTAEIDEAIAKKQRLIELLKEQKAILINQATSSGHRIRLRYLVKGIEQGWSPNTDNSIPSPDSWGVLTAGCVNGGVYSDTAFKVLPRNIKPKLELEVRVGDILMSRASGSIDLIGSAGLVRATRERLMFSDKVFRVTTNRGITPEYFVVAVGATNARQQIKLMISGAGGLANNLGIANIKNIELNVPSIQEQSKITSHLNDQLAEIDFSAEKIMQQIKTLEEFKSILISEAVTGKIKL
jgi:type I restriction enzyme S subunit